MPANRMSLFDLGIDEVSVVDRGDNLGADILMWKRAGDGFDPIATPTAEGIEGVTDGDIQKLIQDELVAKGYTAPTLRFEDDGSVTLIGTEGGSGEGVIKSAISRIAGVFGWNSEEMKKAETAAYTPPDFDQLQGQKFVPKISEEVADMVGSLMDSLMMAANSDDMPANMKRSLGQFTTAMEAATTNWLNGKSAFQKAGRKMSAARVSRLKDLRDTLDGLINDVTPTGDDEGGSGEGSTQKREDDAMTIDRDQLAPEVRAEIEKAEQKAEELQKKLDGQGSGGQVQGGGDQPTTDAPQSEIQKALASVEDPATRAVLQKMAEESSQNAVTVAEMRKKAEEESYIQKARDWKVGEPEEFGKSFRRVSLGVAEAGDVERVEKGIAAMGGQAAVSHAIDSQVSKAQAAAGETGETALAKANTMAQELRKSDDTLSLEGARAKVWADNPSLRQEYEAEQGRTA